MLEVQRAMRSGELTLDDLHNEPYSLKISADGPLVGLKYSMIESRMGLDIVQECRGLILDREKNWEVVSFPLPKFFNAAEGHAAEIDWDSAVAYEKLDGTCVCVYHHEGEWHCHTLGTLYADGPVAFDATVDPEVRDEWEGKTFADLFWAAADRAYGKSRSGFLKGLDPDKCYVFELCTPANPVVTRYDSWRLVLIGVRLLDEEMGFPELPVERLSNPPPGFGPTGHLSWLDTPDHFQLSEFEAAEEYVRQLRPDEEGVVIRDGGFNRIKLKADSYVAMHRMKGGTLSRKHGMVEIVRDGIGDDFIGAFPALSDDVERTRDELRALIKRIDDLFFEFGGSYLDPDDPSDRKEFALNVQAEAPNGTQGVFFAMLDDDMLTAEEAVRRLDAAVIARHIES